MNINDLIKAEIERRNKLNSFLKTESDPLKRAELLASVSDCNEDIKKYESSRSLKDCIS